MIQMEVKLEYRNLNEKYNSCVSPSKALALSEGDKPYAIEVFEDGDLLTLGLLDYDKRLGHNFTAHPKVDPFTSSYSEIEVFREALEHMTAILNIVSYKLDMVISRPMQASNTSHYSLFRPSCKGGLSYPLNQGWFFPDVFPFHEALEIPCR
ncbi:Dixin [Trifolium repens]|nr:Dixin [Trifolium repens]